MSFEDMTFNSLKKLCKDNNIDTGGIRNSEELIKLLQDNKIEPKPKLVIATPEDIKSFAPTISETKIRIDNIRSMLRDLFGTRYQFTIDENDMTVHFMGANRGLECTTLQQPDKAIIATAKRYMGYTAISTGEVDMEEAGRIAKRLANR